MYCLTNMCYVCLEKKDKSLIDITSTLSVNKDIMQIISDLPFNLGWMKTKQIILICEECCRRLRETYQLLAMCLKNSVVMQGYMAKINMSNTDNEAELCVDLNNEQDDVSEIKCEIKVEQEEMYTIGPMIEESDEVYVNVDDYFVKAEDNWDTEELLINDNESDWEMAVNSNTHDTDTDSDSSAFTPTQVHTTNRKKRNTPANGSLKCPTCNKTFTRKKQLQGHKRSHKLGRQFKCATCAKYFRDNFDLVRHVRTHTGEKPYECSVCNKCFSVSALLTIHMRTHNDESAYECDICKKCFTHSSGLVAHMMIHTGEQPYKCSRCNKQFRNKRTPMRHIKKCTVCGDEFCSKPQLKKHMRVHIEQ